MIKIAGIFAIYKKTELSKSLERRLLKLASRLRHRGLNNKFEYNKFPIQLIFYQMNNQGREYIKSFAVNKESDSILLIDGNFYNLQRLFNHLKEKNPVKTYETVGIGDVLEGLQRFGKSFLKKLNGSFSGVWFDGKDMFGFKDPVGAKPLYYSNTDNYFVVSSEMKALSSLNTDIIPISPGNIISSNGRSQLFYQFPDFVTCYKLNTNFIKKKIQKLNELIKVSIKDNINKGEKISVLLSGGIDSIIIAHVAKDLIDDLEVFTVGIDGSNDLKYADKFAKINNLTHHKIEVSIEEMFNSLQSVIYALETFDAALIRSSVPMFLLSKYIHDRNGTDVLLTGEGGDELFGGYDYLSEFKTIELVHQELRSLLEIEHITGLQRVDRIPYHFSIEARAPIFDRRIVEFSFSIPLELKIYKNNYGKAEKWILRKAFETEIQDEFIWRKKQKFSDGAGTEFLLKNYVEDLISDEEYIEECRITHDFNIRSKEELHYWRIFEQKFSPTLKTINQIGITSNYKI